jgi:hypothetical protein
MYAYARHCAPSRDCWSRDDALTVAYTHVFLCFCWVFRAVATPVSRGRTRSAWLTVERIGTIIGARRVEIVGAWSEGERWSSVTIYSCPSPFWKHAWSKGGRWRIFFARIQEDKRDLLRLGWVAYRSKTGESGFTLALRSSKDSLAWFRASLAKSASRPYNLGL